MSFRPSSSYTKKSTYNSTLSSSLHVWIGSETNEKQKKNKCGNEKFNKFKVKMKSNKMKEKSSFSILFFPFWNENETRDHDYMWFKRFNDSTTTTEMEELFSLLYLGWCWRAVGKFNMEKVWHQWKWKKKIENMEIREEKKVFHFSWEIVRLKFSLFCTVKKYF